MDVRLDLAPDLPPIHADAGQMQQLVMNLIINAGEAIDAGIHGTVEVRTGDRELTASEIGETFASEALTPGRYVWLEVRETDAATRTANRGFADFLKKPFSVDRLTEAVASALGLEEE